MKKKVKVRGREGKVRYEVRKVKEAVAASLVMPNEFLAQNGAVIHQTTKIAVTGCPVARKAKKTKVRGKGKKR